jgi:hypothetical protein
MNKDGFTEGFVDSTSDGSSLLGFVDGYQQMAIGLEEGVADGNVVGEVLSCRIDHRVSK